QIRLIDSDCHGADFRRANLSGADLTGANLQAARFKRSVWTEETKWDGKPPKDSFFIHPFVRPGQIYRINAPINTKQTFSNWSPDAAAINSGMKLFSISVGTDDFLYEPVKKNIAMFKAKKIRVKSYVVPGGHTWMNGKQYLATTLQEIFR
ncbi:MAG: hypothetical protein EOO05_18385, partial [Chitinophagaceae bacterium]